MKREHIWFHRCESDGHYLVRAKRKGDPLGEVYWHTRWKTWVFEPLDDSYWSADCLEAVVQFLKELNAQPRPTRKRWVK